MNPLALKAPVDFNGIFIYTCGVLLFNGHDGLILNICLNNTLCICLLSSASLPFAIAFLLCFPFFLLSEDNILV